LFVGGSLICRCRRKNHAYTHTTITVPWEKARRRKGSKSAIGSVKNKKSSISSKTVFLYIYIYIRTGAYVCVRHGINRDQNFYCFFLCTRQWRRPCVCVCVTYTLETFNVFIRIPFDFQARGVLLIYVDGELHLHTRAYSNTQRFKSSPFDVIGSYTHLVHTYIIHTHT